MQLTLWIASGLLAFVMVGGGAIKLVVSRVVLMERMHRARILPVLTPIAAVCLAILMGGAVKTHLDLEEPIAAPLVMAALFAGIAVARFAAL